VKSPLSSEDRFRNIGPINVNNHHKSDCWDRFGDICRSRSEILIAHSFFIGRFQCRYFTVTRDVINFVAPQGHVNLCNFIRQSNRSLMKLNTYNYEITFLFAHTWWLDVFIIVPLQFGFVIREIRSTISLSLMFRTVINQLIKCIISSTTANCFSLVSLTGPLKLIINHNDSVRPTNNLVITIWELLSKLS
jgi:hypothetical protein